MFGRVVFLPRTPFIFVVQIMDPDPKQYPERILIIAALRLPGGGAMLGAAHVVTTSVGMCDVDLRYGTYLPTDTFVFMVHTSVKKSLFAKTCGLKTSCRHNLWWYVHVLRTCFLRDDLSIER